MLGIGSSASTDGGAGMLAALGARIVDADGQPIAPGARGLATAASVDLSGLRPLPRGGVVVLSDVTNPLLGPRGATAVFGPQKGLDADGVVTADAALARFAALVVYGARRVGAAVIAGRIADDADVSGFAASVSLTDLTGSGAAALAEPARWLRAAGAAVAAGR